MEKLTPMMVQYMDIKKSHQDSILFFRLGDFYEMFFDDAITASKILNITLTGKSCGLKQRAPMCGVPYHSSAAYIQKLILAGKKVAICEQVEDPATAKGIVKREVVKIVTPGTIMDEGIIDTQKNNYFMGISLINKKLLDISYLDVTTNKAKTETIDINDFYDLYLRISPAEMICDENAKELILNGNYKNFELVTADIKDSHIIVNLGKNIYDPDFIKTHNLSASINSSLYMILKYIFDTQKTLNNFFIKDDTVKTMKLDSFTIKNLEILQSLNNSRKKGSLLWTLDKTSTPMGSRKLKNWIENPLVKKADITQRLDIVDIFLSNIQETTDITSVLSQIYDIERICNRLSYDVVTHSEIIKLKHSLKQIPLITTMMKKFNSEHINTLISEITDLKDPVNLIENAIYESENGIQKNDYKIKTGYDSELDSLRDLINNSNMLLLEMESNEKCKTGIKNLKIGFNKVFGYYIEITKGNLKDFVPPADYIRKQTLSNGERYINEELKILEEKILNAKSKSDELEKRLYNEIKIILKKDLTIIFKNADIIAKIDCLLSYAIAAYQGNFVRPIINNDGYIKIKNGRHPIIEKTITGEYFVPNDTAIERNNIQIITGPNMAGKSTYMRQVALLVLMSHIGSFIPCESADICITDRVFTRIGANDDLSSGKSTFMVEMTEIADIIQNATDKSLILLDEIGRGTSTYDGMSIAYSIIEYIDAHIKAKTLVSTHYHEITVLEDKSDNICNLCMAVDESDNKITFLRKLIKGKADKSYGIHVAKLADLPPEIIKTAENVLESLESNNQKLNVPLSADKPIQLSFETHKESEAERIIKNTDLDKLTPLDAMVLLNDLKKRIG